MTGAHGREPAAAWLALNPVEREDYRKAGCLEAEVAAAGIVRRADLADQGRRPLARAGQRQRRSLGDHRRSGADAAREKDGVSISVMRDTAKYLGMAAANLVVLADPETLVLGGVMAARAICCSSRFCGSWDAGFPAP